MTLSDAPAKHVSNTSLDHTAPDAEAGAGDGDEGARSSPIQQGIDEVPPPLPPRPKQSLIQRAGEFLKPPIPGFRRTTPSEVLPVRATTALSLTKAQKSPTENGQSVSPSSGNDGGEASKGSSLQDDDEAMTIRSFTGTVQPFIDAESMLGDVLDRDTMAWNNWSNEGRQSAIIPVSADFADTFEKEFDELDDMTSDGLNEGAVLRQWKNKLKQFFILSKAGKPIWSRHGTDQLVTSYIGVILTLIAVYEDASNSLRGFSAGETRFVILAKGQLYLVATSSLHESDQQMRAQLEALYMQILSTLTLPMMEKMFQSRASIDLRRPLQGTDKLLSALADGFTRGSPSTLLSSLECLRMRKSQRLLINNALLKTRSESLLYGLVVAGGRLVSVVRPRKHSLHPGDLHLVFNMLFEARGVRANEGENWIPLCLPGFNNTGYVYMYVSFLDLDSASEQIKKRASPLENLQEVAIILISANKEAFFELQQMKVDLVNELTHDGSMKVLKHNIKRGRMTCTDVVPDTSLKHFIFKSKRHVQFVMPSFEPHFASLNDRRLLLTLYAQLQASLHSRSTSPRIHYRSNASFSALGWSTQSFELYVLATSNINRLHLSQLANRVVQFIRREEERVFIIGGAAF